MVTSGDRTIRNSKPKLVAEIPHLARKRQKWGYTKVAIASTSVFDPNIDVDLTLVAQDLCAAGDGNAFCAAPPKTPGPHPEEPWSVGPRHLEGWQKARPVPLAILRDARRARSSG